MNEREHPPHIVPLYYCRACLSWQKMLVVSNLNNLQRAKKAKQEKKGFLHRLPCVRACVRPGGHHVTAPAPIAACLRKLSDKRSAVKKQHAGGALLSGAVAGAAQAPRPPRRRRRRSSRPLRLHPLRQLRQHQPALQRCSANVGRKGAR